ncbi:MAG: class I SAM-dependent methyltransferase [Patescibacteria group bacterium]
MSIEKEPFNTINPENKGASNLFDGPIDGKVGALKSAYLKSLAELVTGEPIQELSIEEEPERTIESDHHYPKNEEISKYFSTLMKDKIVLDLGCGVQVTGYKIANFSDAKKYIGVEKHFAKTAFERTSQVTTPDSTPFEIAQQDMIDYVQDRSHKADIVILVGIDLIIIPEYQWERLIKGIHEIISEDGRLLIGGGGTTKPWDLIEKYFTKDNSLEEIERKNTDLMFAMLPSVWKKRQNLPSQKI